MMVKGSDEFTLLIGNGLNRLALENISWEDLLKNLSTRLGYKYKETDKDKPLPLFFEEVILRKYQDYYSGIKEAKQFIAEELIKLVPNQYHSDIKTLGLNAILTTNYDYLIEKGIYAGFTRENIGSVTQEQTHSLFRRIEIKEISIWHIHGEINDFKNNSPRGKFRPNTILLGFDQYTNYLREIQKYVKEYIYSSDRKLIIRKSIFRKIKDGDALDINSWIDYFFCNNLIILGLTLDFSEIDLWWILTYRSIYIQNMLQKISVNRIFYLVPCFDQPNNINKHELLEALGVSILEIQAKNYEDFYRKSFEKIKNRELPQ